MMMTINYVEQVTKNEIIIICYDKKLKKALTQLGGKRQLLSPNKWLITFSSKKELASVFSSLRENAVCFASAAGGWPPSAVFEELRKDGLIEGEFNEIVWLGAERFEIHRNDDS